MLISGVKIVEKINKNISVAFGFVIVKRYQDLKFAKKLDFKYISFSKLILVLDLLKNALNQI
mgnify:CR=1 FL=1